MPALQAALLRRSMDEFDATRDRCAHCSRTLLTGEQVFICSPKRIVCELCISLEPDPPRESRLVHGPEFGHTIRVVDQRVRA
jgi:nitrite reductase/ring-hydroxylating ferredoxin subunit